jgi:hypothetical protein
MTRGPRVEIVIDELVFRGLPVADARAAAAALEARLAALAAEAGPVPTAHDEAVHRPLDVSVPAGSKNALGEVAAGAVWSAVSAGGDAGRSGRR